MNDNNPIKRWNPKGGITPRPCIFCTDDNPHARAYPVDANPGLYYCPTCKLMFDKTEYDDVPRGVNVVV